MDSSESNFCQKPKTTATARDPEEFRLLPAAAAAAAADSSVVQRWMLHRPSDRCVDYRHIVSDFYCFPSVRFQQPSQIKATLAMSRVDKTTVTKMGLRNM